MSKLGLTGLNAEKIEDVVTDKAETLKKICVPFAIPAGTVQLMVPHVSKKLSEETVPICVCEPPTLATTTAVVGALPRMVSESVVPAQAEVPVIPLIVMTLEGEPKSLKVNVTGTFTEPGLKFVDDIVRVPEIEDPPKLPEDLKTAFIFIELLVVVQ